MNFKESQEAEKDFTHRVKGALMYKGGNFENNDLTRISAKDFIHSCFCNNIVLTCRVEHER